MSGVAFQRLLGKVYDLGAQWPPTARFGAWVEWAASLDAMYRSMATIAAMRPGTTVLDVPCGGGLAFGNLDANQGVHYIAADASQLMLGRAQARARKLRLSQIEPVLADVCALPLPSETVDLCVSYNGLQCFPDPVAAISEMSRCLRPDGKLVGTTVVTGESARADRMIRLYRRIEAFGPGGSNEDLQNWLTDAGFVDVELQGSGALTLFSAKKPRTAPGVGVATSQAAATR
jgi:SAM-dependent methyltransferase